MDPYEAAAQIDHQALPEVGWDDPAESDGSILAATVIEDARLVPREWHPELLPYGGDPFFEADPADLGVFYGIDLGEVA